MTVEDMERAKEYREGIKELIDKVGKGEPSVQTRTYLDTIRVYSIGYINILKDA